MNGIVRHITYAFIGAFLGFVAGFITLATGLAHIIWNHPIAEIYMPHLWGIGLGSLAGLILASRQAEPVRSGCGCSAVGAGVQLFRIRLPLKHFRELRDLGARKVWQCLACDQFYALMRLPYKSEEDILVRAPHGDWQSWDWEALARAADGCRWAGSTADVPYVL
jgi:hypothetical protein